MGEVISVGAIEFASVVAGYQALDALMKSATTTLHVARSVSPGNFLVVFSGSVGDINMAMETARQVGGSQVVDFLTVANIHPALFPAMAEEVVLDPEKLGALGVVETRTAVSAMVAADAACKAASVTLFKLAFNTELNGKGLLLMNGALSDVQAAVAAGIDAIQDGGFLVDSAVIPRPGRELFLGVGDKSGANESPKREIPGDLSEEIGDVEKTNVAAKPRRRSAGAAKSSVASKKS
jgi:microcompartment protein CcmL/EutN